MTILKKIAVVLTIFINIWVLLNMSQWQTETFEIIDKILKKKFKLQT
jgi:hypothetical protein